MLCLLGHLLNDCAVRGPNPGEVHCFTVGAYCHVGGIARVRNNTRFVRQRSRKHRFAVIGLFQGQCTSLHNDAWNEPSSYTLVIPLKSVTGITGGSIWIEDPEGNVQRPQRDCNAPGKVLELPASFQPSKKHCAVHWAEPLGTRVVLVAFSPRGLNRPQVFDLRLLKSL